VRAMRPRQLQAHLGPTNRCVCVCVCGVLGVLAKAVQGIPRQDWWCVSCHPPQSGCQSCFAHMLCLSSTRALRCVVDCPPLASARSTAARRMQRWQRWRQQSLACTVGRCACWRARWGAGGPCMCGGCGAAGTSPASQLTAAGLACTCHTCCPRRALAMHWCVDPNNPPPPPQVADRLNAMGVPCNLVTGQEVRSVKGARHTACTVEMADLSTRVQVRERRAACLAAGGAGA
jgi:hypothetical protein